MITLTKFTSSSSSLLSHYCQCIAAHGCEMFKYVLSLTFLIFINKAFNPAYWAWIKTMIEYSTIQIYLRFVFRSLLIFLKKFSFMQIIIFHVIFMIFTQSPLLIILEGYTLIDPQTNRSYNSCFTRRTHSFCYSFRWWSVLVGEGVNFFICGLTVHSDLTNTDTAS